MPCYAVIMVHTVIETKKNPSATNDLTGIPESKCNTRIKNIGSRLYKRV